MPTRSLTNSLTRSVTRGLTDPALGGFTPGASFFAGSQGFAYDLSDKSKLYVDSARTVQVATAGDLIGSVSDLSGNGNHASQGTTASKPAWQTTYAALDGFDDFWATASLNFTATDKVTVVVGVRKLSDASIGIIAELSQDAGLNNGFYTASDNSSAGYRVVCGSPVAGIKTASTSLAAPNTSVVTGQYNKSAGGTAEADMAIRVNGVAQSEVVVAPADPAGNFSNSILYIGRRAGAQLPFNGRIYRMIVIGRLLNATELAQAERWCNTTTGAY